MGAQATRAVSYGGVSGGLRATQVLKPTLAGLGLTIAGEVPVPFFAQFIGDDGVFRPNEVLVKGAAGMFAGIERWAKVLGPMRANS